MPDTPPLPRVPLADPGGDNAFLRSRILEAVSGVFDGGAYILGPEVTAFERELATDLGCPGTVGVASGTDALALALIAGGAGPGDEVITVSHTAGPTVAAIHMTGATPVLVDIDPVTFCIDPGTAEAAIGPRTKALIAVHLYGHPADMPRLAALGRRHGLTVIEDCAQAQGGTIDHRQVGTFGDFGCFSFYPTKNLGALGDGGAIAAASADVLSRVRHLRCYGWSSPQYAEIPHGRCSRLDEIQAAILRLKLGSLHAANERRRQIAACYRAGLAGLPVVLPADAPGCRHVYHLYVIRTPAREALAAHLADRGVATGRHYPYPVHRQPGLASGARLPAPLPETERACAEILSLPMFPGLSEAQIDRVVTEIRSFFGGK